MVRPDTTLLTSVTQQSPIIPKYTGSIWRNVASVGLSEEQAKEICANLIQSFEFEGITPDSDANEFDDVTTEIIDIVMDERRNKGLFEEEAYELDYEPFLSTPKITSENLNLYMNDVQEPYYCVICMIKHTNPEKDTAVRLICNGEKCVFCKPCIYKWLTTSTAKCPYCQYNFNK
uniref:RING-type domain-containing protein n=1 Tax=viral metagenome TaxID=1070528 RepID=A0A6C0J480_9ZZZZ